MRFGWRILFIFILGFVCTACGGGAEQQAADQQVAQPTLSLPAEATSTPAAVPTVAPPAEPTARAAPTSVAGSEPVDITPVKYNGDFATSIAPIFATGCASCHNVGGPGAVHWKLEQAGDLVATHEWIADVVGSRVMPPWPASDLSPVFHETRSLRNDQIEAIVAWSQAGAPLDVDEGTQISAPNGVVALDTDIEIEPHEIYQGSTEVVDDYRCFIYDLEVTEPQWVRGFEFVPDQTQIVHHAVGYLAPAEAMTEAHRLSAQDDIGGWQCYGGPGLRQRSDLFLGWAPGQLPTVFPEGSGLLVEEGAFMIVQIHYHLDTPAADDASTLRIDWADGDGDGLDRIEYDEFLGPAEIPCSSDESGPLCDRQAAIVRANETYGPGGVLANGINGICGVTPADFADMTDGIASSSCILPIRNYGEVVAVFGHEHEIGKSFRMTLNPGRSEEQVLLDIPEWSFDWQYNYYPADSILVGPGDVVQIECSWDRSLRDPDLEPAYVLWADGTNDEMCFGAITTRQTDEFADFYFRDIPDPADVADNEGGFDTFDIDVPDELAACLADGGVSLDSLPAREDIDAVADQLHVCAERDEIVELLQGVIQQNFAGLVSPDAAICIAEGLATPQGTRDLFFVPLADATPQERQPVAEIVGDCLPFSEAAAEFGFPLPESAAECIDDIGRPVIVAAIVDGVLPEAQILLGTIAPCLAGN